MAKALSTISKIAGAVATVAQFIPGGQAVAAIAFAVSAVAGIGARLLTKPPPARGSITDTIIDVDPPSPYGMGEGYFGGVLRHKIGYGPTLKKVPNPFLFEAVALCVAGPIAGPIVPQVDFGPVTSYYSGWLATDTRLGQRPDTALTAPLQANPTGWSANHRLSGVAAIAWNHKFDKDGKIYASGLPTRGVVAKWALCYDPRKDSTRPGGSGSHRLGVETTYEWSENPALHAGTYAYGRFVNGKRVIGVGLPDEGIDWEGVAAWANDCQANGWRMFGFVFEGAEDDAQRRWQNLRDICIAGGGEPLFSGAVLGFHWQRPRVPLDTVTEADLADGPQEVTAMQSWRDRLNTVRPRYTSPAHNWSLVQAQQVQVASYLAEDGEERVEDIPFNFVKDVNQAAQLAAYWLTNSRELTPITLTLMPRLRDYRPGECLHLQLPELGLDHDAVILRRQFDPASMTVTLTLVTEDPAKHAFALGRTGVAPPTPSLTNSAEDRDTITREARAPYWPEVDGPGKPEDGATNTAPANANRVPFSRVEGGLGWRAVGDVTSTVFANVFQGKTYAVTQPVFTAANQSQYLASTPTFPVNAGERLSAAAHIDAFALSGAGLNLWNLYVEYYNASDTLFAATIFASGTTGLSERRSGFVDVPAGAVRASLVLQARAAGAGQVQMAIMEPMIASAATGQTLHPPFSPGPVVVEPINAGGPLLVGQLPPSKADPGLINANVPVGANAVVNSDFTRGKFGWRWRGGGFESNWGVNLTGSPNWFGQRNVMWATVPGAFGAGLNHDLSPDAIWAGAPTANAPLFALPVVGGDRLFAGVLAARHRCTFQLWILQFDSAWSLVSAEQVTGGSPGGAANGDPANFTRISLFSTAVATARWAIPMMRMIGTGESDPYIFFTEPMLAKVAAGQTVAPPYAPGRADSLADETATAQRSIEPQFPSIEIKQGEAGNTDTRTVTHVAKRGTTALTGGTWSLVSSNLGTGSATINAGTGTVSLSGIVQSGSYTVRYTHTDGLVTEITVNVTYVPTPSGGTVSAKTAATTSNTGVGNTNSWSQVIALTLTGTPVGRLFFNNFGLSGGNSIDPSTGTGTCSHQARLLINGSVAATADAQPTFSGGVRQFVDFSALFQDAWPVSGGTITVSVELQRTSGTGTINTMSNSLDVTIIAS